MNMKLAQALVQTLPASAPGLFNPWVGHCPYDTPLNGPSQRLERLAQHLDCDAQLILVGEAPGYQGCRYSGVAFTSERLLLAGEIPRIPAPSGRLTARKNPFSEPSATIVWRKLKELGIDETTILWNALQMHPFKPNESWSNRTPTPAELAHGRAGMEMLREAFPKAKVVAIGKKAEALLTEAGIDVVAAIRHPANGGATKFASGLAEVMAGR